MGVVGGGSSAARAVVEQGVAGQHPGQAQQVGQARGDALGHVVGSGQGQVAREDGEGIDQNVVASFQRPDGFLFRRAVRRTEEARPLADGTLVYAGSGRNDTGRVALHAEGRPVHVQRLYTHPAQGGVVVLRRGPVDQLAGQKVIYVFVHTVVLGRFSRTRAAVLVRTGLGSSAHGARLLFGGSKWFIHKRFPCVGSGRCVLAVPMSGCGLCTDCSGSCG